MSMKPTLELINKMQAHGVIGKYAIGGAVGATFYLEPAATLDVDVFVVLPSVANSSLLSLSPIYQFLSTYGCQPEGEHIVVGGWPVQFLPASDSLEMDALEQAVATEVEGERAWVMTAEHLVAIALRTARAKDHARILQFLELDAVDGNRLESILSRYGLLRKWQTFLAKYVDK